MSIMKKDELNEEIQHYKSVLFSFKEYDTFELREIFRRKKHFENLSQEHKMRLPPNSTSNSISRLVNAMKENQKFLNSIYQVQYNIGYDVQLPPKDPKGKLRSPFRHFSKLRSTLHQCVRDWSEEGREERERCYTPLVQELKRLFPDIDNNKNPIRVLVPGAGLGRLALEIAAVGFSTQGNEFSYQMLFTSNYILNSMEQQEVIHPWIHNPSNTMSMDDHVRGVSIPDIAPRDLLMRSGSTNPDFSMCAGEFLDAYSGDTACWDAIVTCFFIDAAPNVIEYIESFYRMLKPGGIWINLGPLLYHWQNSCGDGDDRYNQSVELTYEEILHVTKSFGFNILNESRKECLYTCNQYSMMRTVYNCAMFSAMKPAN